MDEQQLINELYEKASFWSDFYEDKDSNLAFAFDAIGQCLMLSQTVYPLTGHYTDEQKSKALEEAKNYINTIQKNYATTNGAKDSQTLFKQYLERF